MLPQSFTFLRSEPALVLPLQFDRTKTFVGNFSYQGLARLKPGVTLEQANADVARLLPGIPDQFPLPPGFTREDVRRPPHGAEGARRSRRTSSATSGRCCGCSSGPSASCC